MKIYIRIIIVLIIVVGAIYASWKMELIETKDLQIAKTQNVVTEINRITEYTTACYYEEVVIIEKKPNVVLEGSLGKAMSSIVGHKAVEILEDEIAIIVKGTVRAGFDLSHLTTNDVEIRKDTIEIRLPHCKIFDVIVNPSDFEIYAENGTWTHEMVSKIEQRAKPIIEADAKQNGLMDLAQKNGESRLTSLFETLGFEKVILK